MAHIVSSIIRIYSPIAWQRHCCRRGQPQWVKRI